MKRLFSLSALLLVLSLNILGQEDYLRYWFRFSGAIAKENYTEAMAHLKAFQNLPLDLYRKNQVSVKMWKLLVQNGRKRQLPFHREALALLAVDSPFRWQIEDDLAWMAFRRGDIPSLFNHSIKAARFLSRSFPHTLLSPPLLSSLVATLVAALFLLVLFVLVDRVNLLRSDWGPRSWPSLLTVLFFALLPTVLFLGVFYVPFLLAGLLLTYLSQGERRLAGALFLLLFLATGLSLYISSKNRLAQDPLSRMVFEVSSELAPPDRIRDAEHLFAKNKDPLLGMTLGLFHYREKHLFEAKEILEKVPLHPLFNRDLYTQLGNINYQMGFFRDSEEYYRKGLSVSPNDPVILYNLGVLLNKLGQYELAQNYFLRSPLTSSSDDSREILTPSPLLPSPLSFYPHPIKLSDLLSPLPTALLLWLLGALFSLIVTRFRSLSVSCSTCLKPVSRRTPGLAQEEYCEECFNLFVVRDPLLGEMRKVRYNEIESGSQRRSKGWLSVSLLFPGFFFLSLKRPLFYILFSLPFLFSLLLPLFLRKALLPLRISGSLCFPFPFFILAALLYILGILATTLLGRKEWL
ncbi:MAG TPA: tetratricopeptide repeat protein [Candidatus Aminicenantes bacterium]|nr:tetratricopeptide repeat protein [Candidatus Aminicenantes bacterium]